MSGHTLFQPAIEDGSPKRRQVLEAASELFLAHGYGAVSMDAVARRAGVSKATLYAHFASKDVLFGRLMGECAASTALDDTLFPACPSDLRVALEAIGQRMLRFLLQERTMSIYRIAIAECQRFPELGRTFYDSGPVRGHAAMAAWLAGLQRAGLVRAADPYLAARHFLSLIRADLVLRASLALPPPPTDQEIDQAVTSAVATWLAAFAAAPVAPPGGA